MNIDFDLLKNSVGKEFKFETSYKFSDKEFTDKFYAELIWVENDFIIVQQRLLYMTEDNENNLGVFRRKLNKGGFTIDTKSTPLNR